ncbi:glycerol-3-phosphate 1-O-acyltransferase [Saccharobesus litoralis]|uniref:Glycerol-3-phosphate acyltransferase n=1 Tax=Saccharobesus litoralis TaxID=2172099 RepID=A0A2S0VWR1_9ALTE|nr:glycerol-3-phosphate 1-O-acyltransferase PlsB [Saccharobesus litoralis]AWB68657.1 glycerol-3-phosphate 1-O-acyltransferase [Saccharobesus litoralis]
MSELNAVLSHVLKWPVRPFIRTKVIPAQLEAEINIDHDKPLFYVLKEESIFDLLALQRICKKFDLPSPFSKVNVNGTLYTRYICLDRMASSLKIKRKPTEALSQVEQLLKQHKEQTGIDAQLIPCFSTWGRYPGKANLDADVVFNDQRKPSALAKFFIVLFSGRHNLIQFSQPVSCREVADDHGSDKAIAQKLLRVARFHFQRQKLAIAGPKLWERDQLINSLLASPALKKVIEDEAKSKNISINKARETARQYLDEMAADYRENAVRIGDRVLTWIWNKLYHGIHITNVETVRKLAHEGHEVVYVPCHRSHMDYLLLTYVIYHEGLVPPHIAAGINLNFWPMGPIFRRGGAFFMRRSFRGNKLYSAAFREYMAQLLSRGYAIKYYPESGRSRTGRLLKPKTGMLAMTVQSALRGLDRPITLVPVYIGYEHVMEVSTYMRELGGAAKQKESFWQVLGILRKLRHFGQGYVNFGEPISLNKQLNSKVENWREDIHPTIPQKPTWFPGFVNDIAQQVMCNINRAAALNGVNLSALALLAAPKHSLFRDDLENQLKLCLALLEQHAPFSELTLPPDPHPKLLVEHAISMDKYQVEKGKTDIISLTDSEAVLQTYYRNNVLHVFLLPSLAAASLIADAKNNRATILTQWQTLLRLIAGEYFLKFSQAQLEAHLDHILATLKDYKMLTIDNQELQAIRHADSRYQQLHLLASYCQETLQRYAIVLAVLEQTPAIARTDLESQALDHAKQLAKLNGIKGPEFVDKSLINQLILKLRELGYLQSNDDGLLESTDTLGGLRSIVFELLDGDILATIRHP